MHTNYRYMIGSGWWCSGEDAALSHHKGDAKIRTADFHRLWYEQICNNTNPSRILIVDSASPVLPSLNENDERVHLHRLATNPGHATNCSTQFCGWTAAVLCGLQDFIHTDNDYFVYVEQDVLLHGKGIIEYAISKMTSPFMFGDAKGIPQPLQQSFFIIRKDGAAQFLSKLLGMPESDKELSPERKFHYACQSGLLSSSALRWVGRKIRKYDFLPFGYGRKRPIDFDAPYYYFQHGTSEELSVFKKYLKT